MIIPIMLESSCRPASVRHPSKAKRMVTLVACCNRSRPRCEFAPSTRSRNRKLSPGTQHSGRMWMSENHHRDQGGRLGTVSPGAVQPTVPDDLVAMLDLLAQTIVQALGFGVAAVNIARPGGSLEVVSVAGDDDARRMLLGTVHSAEVWDQILAVSEPWGRLRFADHRNEAANQELYSWVPDIVPITAEDAWHPEDALFAPLTAKDGSRLGILSVDLPQDGLRPNQTTCRALEAFAVSTALAIEHATLRSRAESSERSLKLLATHDSLTGVGNRSMLFDRLDHAASARLGRVC